MTAKKSIAKGLLWIYIKVKGVDLRLGGMGHSLHVCGLNPGEGPDYGPWVDICSPRICPYYEDCLKMVNIWREENG